MSIVEPHHSMASPASVPAEVPRPRTPGKHSPHERLQQQVTYPEAGTAVLTVTGDVDAATASRFEEMLQSRLCSQLQRLVLDLARLRFLGLDGVSAVMAAELRARSSAAELVVVSGHNREVTRAMRATSDWHHLRWHTGPLASAIVDGGDYWARD